MKNTVLLSMLSTTSGNPNERQHPLAEETLKEHLWLMEHQQTGKVDIKNGEYSRSCTQENRLMIAVRSPWTDVDDVAKVVSS
jgi:hypothetical protein